MADTGENKQNSFADTGLAWWRDIRLALKALTILPNPGLGEHGPEADASAQRAFPIAGLVIGVIVAAVFAVAMDLKLWKLASSILAIGALVVLTGTRTEMGVAAFSDALYRKAQNKDRIADMAHPHLGVHGLLALLFQVSLKVALIMAAASTKEAAAALIAASAAARTVLPLVTYNLPAVVGLAETPTTVKPTRDAVWTAGALGVAFVLLFLGPLAGFAALLFGGVVGAAAAWRIKHELGGYTQESLAVVLSATEIAVLIAAIVIA